MRYGKNENGRKFPVQSVLLLRGKDLRQSSAIEFAIYRRKGPVVKHDFRPNLLLVVLLLLAKMCEFMLRYAK